MRYTKRTDLLFTTQERERKMKKREIRIGIKERNVIKFVEEGGSVFDEVQGRILIQKEILSQHQSLLFLVRVQVLVQVLVWERLHLRSIAEGEEVFRGRLSGMKLGK